MRRRPSPSQPCNLCGSSDSSVLYSPRGGRPDGAAKMTTDTYGVFDFVVRCRKCGLAFLDPVPPPSSAVAAYADMGDPEYLEQQECRSINAHLALQTIHRFVKKGRLLDIGCSAGFLLNAARFSFEVCGVEPSSWASALGREKFGLDIRTGTVDALDLPKAHFDVVTMVDVIEHVADPSATLRRVHELLADGGVLYLVTPDLRSLSARILGRYWWGLRPAHLYYFDRRTMAALLKAAGFRVISEKSYGRIFTFGYWLSRLRTYPRVITAPLGALFRALGIEQKVLYLDTRDSMEICAEKVTV